MKDLDHVVAVVGGYDYEIALPMLVDDFGIVDELVVVEEIAGLIEDGKCRLFLH